MKLTDMASRDRLAGHDHAVLCTLNPERGIDAVPVCYAVVDGDVGVPVDTVKAKTSTQLQRVRNLEGEPRATLLVEHWDRADWSALWWVRAELRWRADAGDRASVLASRLAERYPQYRDRPFSRVLVFDIVAVSGWAADPA